MRKTNLRKIFTRLLMLCILLPVMTITAYAGNYPVLGGITANVSNQSSESFSGGTLTVTAKGSGGFFGLGASARTTTITFTNNSGSDGIFSFNWTATDVNSLTIDGASYSGSGGFTKQLANGGTFKIVITTAKNGTENKLEMKNFQFQKAGESSKVTFVYDESLGSVTVGGGAVANGEIVDVAYDTGAALVATPKDGSKFLGWIKAADHSVISKEATHTLLIAEDTTVQAVFAKASTKAWFDAGGFLYDNLNDAVTKGGTVVLAWDGVLEAGDYTIPSGVTLLIPFDDANTLYTSEPGYNSVKNSGYTAPKAYRTLTMKSGANLTVSGGMSLSAKFFIAGGGQAECGAPTGNVSFVRMESGSAITVNNGGSLYAWGFITGDGSVTAMSGANIYENFQFTDFRGGTQSTGMKDGVFPISQYYIQNIEVPLTLRSGAKETGYTGLYMSRMDFPSSVNFIGKSSCMFNITDGYLVKRYDGAADRLVIDIYGDVSVAGIELKVGFSGINSANYNLPLNSNITVNIHSGTGTFGQKMALLPGSKITIDEGATLKLASGVNAYVYDGDDWGNFCGASNAKLIPIKYAPGKTHTRTEKDLTDVTIQVAGILDASEGYLYTTAGGADICGVGNGTAKINPGKDTVTYQLVQGPGNTEIPVTSAKLHNGGESFTYAGDEEYTTTTGSVKTYYYCASCEKWYTGDNHYTAQVITSGVPEPYKTLKEAITAYSTAKDGKYIRMLTNSGEKVTLADKTVLDLNGYIVKNVAVKDVTVDDKTVSGTLYGMDSTSDGYQGANGSITVSGKVAPVTEFKNKNTTEKTEEGKSYIVSLHRYLAVQGEGNTWSFHRYNISVGEKYYMEIISDKTAKIGVSGYFRGDSAVIEKLEKMGFKFDEADAVMAGAENISDQCTFYYTSDAKLFTEEELTPAVRAALKFTTAQDNYYSIDRKIDFIALLKSYYGSCKDATEKAVLEGYASDAGITLS